MTTDQPKPRRRWLQFSLRTLFVVVTVFCVWMGLVTKAARDQRQAVELCYVRGLTMNEIAEQVAIPLGTVKTRCFLARKKLRQELGEEARELIAGNVGDPPAPTVLQC